MWPLPQHMRKLGVKNATVIRAEGTDDEERFEVEAHIQPDTGFFAVDAPIFEGDIVEYPDARGGTARKVAAEVKVYDVGPREVQHSEVTCGSGPLPRTAAVRRLGLEGLRPEVISVASNLFTDGHYSQAISESVEALERRVKTQSGIDDSGRDLMVKAFNGTPPPIDLSVERGKSGQDEQEGFASSSWARFEASAIRRATNWSSRTIHRGRSNTWVS